MPFTFWVICSTSARSSRVAITNFSGPYSSLGLRCPLASDMTFRNENILSVIRLSLPLLEGSASLSIPPYGIHTELCFCCNWHYLQHRMTLSDSSKIAHIALRYLGPCLRPGHVALWHADHDRHGRGATSRRRRLGRTPASAAGRRRRSTGASRSWLRARVWRRTSIRRRAGRSSRCRRCSSSAATTASSRSLPPSSAAP